MTAFLLQKEFERDPYFKKSGRPVFGVVLVEFIHEETQEYDSTHFVIKQPLQDAGKDHLRREWQRFCHDELLDDPEILRIILEATAEQPRAEIFY